MRVKENADIYRCDQCGQEVDFDEFADDDACDCGGRYKPAWRPADGERTDEVNRKLTDDQVSMILSLASVQCPACAQMHGEWHRPGDYLYAALLDALCAAGCRPSMRGTIQATPESVPAALERAGLA